MNFRDHFANQMRAQLQELDEHLTPFERQWLVDRRSMPGSTFSKAAWNELQDMHQRVKRRAIGLSRTILTP